MLLVIQNIFPKILNCLNISAFLFINIYRKSFILIVCVYIHVYNQIFPSFLCYFISKLFFPDIKSILFFSYIEFFYDLINLIIIFIVILFKYIFTFCLIVTILYCHELLGDSLKWLFQNLIYNTSTLCQRHQILNKENKRIMDNSF